MVFILNICINITFIENDNKSKEYCLKFNEKI